MSRPPLRRAAPSDAERLLGGPRKLDSRRRAGLAHGAVAEGRNAASQTLYDLRARGSQRSADALVYRVRRRDAAFEAGLLDEANPSDYPRRLPPV
mmetsp:Transcript_11563/g.34819  ORF Transcript_11563/g.34819 Transcript_11563/m.34819 type:complete len:95 (+) Transcript_11563:97-381(+)